jgi:hypothetical protein
LNEAPADESGGEMIGGLEDVSALLVADRQPPEAAEPDQVRSTTQRCRPKRSLLSMPRRAIYPRLGCSPALVALAPPGNLVQAKMRGRRRLETARFFVCRCRVSSQCSSAFDTVADEAAR